MKAAIVRDNCGTYAGANAHKRRDENLCDPCRVAAADYVRDWRRRSGRTTRALQPVSEPSYDDLRARNRLAESLVSHRLDTSQPDVAAVLAALRGDLTLAGDE